MTPFDLAGHRRELSACGELSPHVARVQNTNVCFRVGFRNWWVGELSVCGEQFVSVALFVLSGHRQELPIRGELSTRVAPHPMFCGTSGGELERSWS